MSDVASPPPREARRLARQRVGLSVRQVARKTGLSEASIRAFERQGAPHWDRARQLARLYNCPSHLFIPNQPQERPKRSGADGAARRAGNPATASRTAREPRGDAASRPLHIPNLSPGGD